MNNVGLGSYAGYGSSQGDDNIFIGYFAGYDSNWGDDNIMLGNEAGYANANEDENIYIGKSAGRNVTKSFNIGIGREALYNATSENNIAVGYRAGHDATIGGIYIGHSAGFHGAGGINIGEEAGYYGTDYRDIAIGTNALHDDSGGAHNVAMGFYSMESSNGGVYNVALGSYSLHDNYLGNHNVGLGANALDDNTNGDNNTAVGDGSGPFANTYDNTSALGHDATPSASNEVRIGDNYITSIGGIVGWSNFSDARFKKNITENIPGINFIMKLRPVTYTLDVDGLNKFLKTGEYRIDHSTGMPVQSSASEIQSRQDKESILYTGLIAQEVEKAAKELDFNFSGVDAPKNENDPYALRYAEFVMPLIKAVQEQQQMIQDLNKNVEILQQQNLQLQNELGQITKKP
jgi:hypothetical protein